MKRCWIVKHKDGCGYTADEWLIISDSYEKAMRKLEDYLIQLYQGCVVRTGDFFRVYDEIDGSQEDTYYLWSIVAVEGE